MSTLPPPARHSSNPRVQRLLETARLHLGMDVAWVSHFDLDVAATGPGEAAVGAADAGHRRPQR